MQNIIQEEYNKTAKKRDEIKSLLVELEKDEPKDTYNIRINRDRLAYWEGKTEGLKFALDYMK